MLLACVVFCAAAEGRAAATNAPIAAVAAYDLPVDAVTPTDRRLLADGLFSRGLYELAAREYAALADDVRAQGRDVVLFRLGECWRKLGQSAKAEANFERLVREFPDSPERARAQLQAALLAAEDNRPAKAIALLSPLAGEKLPDDIRGAVLHCLGEALEQTGDMAGARARFEQVRREQPGSLYAAFAGLRLGFHLGHSQQAADRLQARAVYRDVAARTNAPRAAAEALFQAAELTFADRQFADSAACYAELRRRYPDDARTAGTALPAAWAHHHAGQYAEALALAAAAGAAPSERRAEWLYLSGNASRQLERPREAAEFYRQLLEGFPSDARAQAARYERLLCLAALKDHAGVLKESDGFVPSDDRRDGLLWLQGESALALDDLPRAMREYRALVERFPDSPFAVDALFRLGWLQQRQQSWLPAAESYRRLIARAPQHALAAKALFSAGICLAQAGQGTNALLAWRELLERYPQYEALDETLYQKAMEEIRADDGSAAVRTLDLLLGRFPQSGRRPEALFWRARVRRQQGAIKPAIADLSEVIKNGAGAEIQREARLLLGALLQQEGREAEAAACFQPLLDGPGRAKLTPDRLAWLCEFQFGRGAFPEAEAAARTLVERERDAVWQQTGWTLLARTVRAQRRPEEAMDALKHALEGDARTRFGAEAALRLGEMLLDAGRLVEAETRLRDAAERSGAPELQNFRAHAYAGLGRCAELRGAPDAAIRHYLAVSILYEDATLVPAALDKAATLLLQVGRKEDSQAAARELVARYPESTQAQAWRTRMGPAAPSPAAGEKGAP
jgi:TolA-binding protein